MDLGSRFFGLASISIGLCCARTPTPPPQIDVVAAPPADSIASTRVRDATTSVPPSDPCVLLLERYPTAPARSTLQLTRVCFDHGAPKGSELIVEVERDKMPGVQQVACLRQDRYVVLDTGLVIDLRSREVIHAWKPGTGFVGCEDQRVILRRWQPAEELEFFDFGSRASGRLEDTSLWRVVLKSSVSEPQGVSPDRRWLAYMHATPAASDSLYVVSLDAAPRQIASGFSFALGPLASPYSSSTPFVWLDASRIVTQRSNGVLVVVHLDGKVEPLVNIPVQTTGAMQPSLRRDASGRLLYDAGNSWVIDVDSKQFAPEESRALGNEFAIAPADAGRGKPLTVRHQGRDVGRFGCDSWSAETTRGAVALYCHDPTTHKVVVWNVETAVWSTIEQGERVAIGWVGAFAASR